MSAPEGGDRRKHARGSTPVSATLVIGQSIPIARVIDVSAGGVLLELPLAVDPPPLHAAGMVELTRGESLVMRHARVVRVRFMGRHKGAPMAAAVALAFDDADLDAAMQWERIMSVT